MSDPSLEWVAGITVVTGLVCALAALLSFALWDLFRQAHGVSLSVTASTWVARFCVRHPFAVFCAGFSVGALAAHFAWGQVVKVPGNF